MIARIVRSLCLLPRARREGWLWWTCLWTVAFVAFGLAPVLAQPCLSNGDVDQDGATTPSDAQQALQHVLGQTTLDACAQIHANVFDPEQDVITVDDLRALSPELTFDHLVIDARLDLPPNQAIALQVNDLTITATGSVGYAQSVCSFLPAPDLTITASGTVRIEGDIALFGKPGAVETTSDTSCEQCTGTAGGEVQIVAQAITVRETIQVDGGHGAHFQDTNVSVGCAGGAGGRIILEGTTLTLDLATLQALGGTGGAGATSNGVDGADGAVSLHAAALLQMQGGVVSTDGTLTLAAAQTDIHGVLTYGQLVDTIGGQPDAEAPVVTILSPLPNAAITVNQALEIRVQVQDGGTGVKEVQVTGLGHDQLHPAADVVDGVLSVVIDQPSVPTSLAVTAVDNRGLTTTQTVEGLTLTGGLAIGVGQTFRLTEDLFLADEDEVIILGTLVLPQESAFTIRAGTLTLAATGQIVAEPPTITVIAQAPSLTLLLSGPATIAGAIDLSGHDGVPTSGRQEGQAGGALTLRGTTVTLAGQALAHGGAGVARFVTPQVSVGASGGAGGMVTVTATADLQISGSITANGGASVNRALGGCFAGGAGGAIVLTAATTADLVEATLAVTGGRAETTSSCAAAPGAEGTVTLVDLFPPLADAGPNQIVAAGEAVMLNGSGSRAPDGQPVTFAWALVSRPAGSNAALSDTAAVMPTFVADMPGTYVIQLSVQDGTTDSSADHVTITVPDTPRATELLVSSAATDAILRYDGQTGTSIDAFVPPGSGGLDFPVGLTFGPDGHLYVSSGNIDAVLRYDGQTGAFLDTFVLTGSGGLDAPLGLVFGPDDHLYVSSAATHAVLRYNDENGTFLDAFIPAGSGGLNFPVGLTFGPDPDGQLYVSSGNTHAVLRYNRQSGAFLDTFVPTGRGGLAAPFGLLFGPDEHLYVSSTFTDTVLRYNGQSGAFLDAFVPAGLGGLDGPTGLVFGPDKHLYVSSSETAAVLRYDGQTGAFLEAVVASGSGGLDGPEFLTFTPLAPGDHPPIADAGADQQTMVDTIVALDGNGSMDVEGQTLTFAWSLISQPADSMATLSEPSSVAPTFAADSIGIYTVQLLVNDGMANSTPDVVTIVVSP